MPSYPRPSYPLHIQKCGSADPGVIPGTMAETVADSGAGTVSSGLMGSSRVQPSLQWARTDARKAPAVPTQEHVCGIYLEGSIRRVGALGLPRRAIFE